jgi:hypothetical protein
VQHRVCAGACGAGAHPLQEDHTPRHQNPQPVSRWQRQHQGGCLPMSHAAQRRSQHTLPACKHASRSPTVQRLARPQAALCSPATQMQRAALPPCTPGLGLGCTTWWVSPAAPSAPARADRRPGHRARPERQLGLCADHRGDPLLPQPRAVRGQALQREVRRLGAGGCAGEGQPAACMSHTTAISACVLLKCAPVHLCMLAKSKNAICRSVCVGHHKQDRT